MHFKKRFDRPRLSSDEAARQGRAARLAWERMPQAGAAVAFLNTHHNVLGGRPIDLAIASDGGLRAVEAAIASYVLVPSGGS
jgi:uncharacterized protein (DUF2384 family)